MITQFNLWHAANKRLKRDCQRVAFPVPLSRGGFGVVFELGAMRCQPLRRALGLSKVWRFDELNHRYNERTIYRLESR
ncbi:hypothetical protein FXE94_09415 [Vibrio cholerae]|nr:hypothetical protein FXE94_09415 [Vibrio cholerae]